MNNSASQGFRVPSPQRIEPAFLTRAVRTSSAPQRRFIATTSRPKPHAFTRPASAPPAEKFHPELLSSTVEADDVILQIQNFAECWKQISRYFALVRSKSFEGEDETQFLETKSVLAQELEMVLTAVKCSPPGRDEVHALLCNLPSLRYLSQQSEGALRTLENQWHQIYIQWHAALGQIKASRLREEPRTRRRGVFSWT